MKKDLDKIRQELEVEIDTAEGLSEIMLLIHTGTQNLDITFEKIASAFYLIVQLFEEHVRNLDHIANGLVDLDNDLRVK